MLSYFKEFVPADFRPKGAQIGHLEKKVSCGIGLSMSAVRPRTQELELYHWILGNAAGMPNDCLC